MSAPCFITWNGSTANLSSPLAGVATSSTSGTVMTMLQVKAGTNGLRVIEWGYAFTATQTAPVKMELIETGTVFATVTAHSAVYNYSGNLNAASAVSLGTSATGYTATAEGTTSATRLLAQTFDTATYFKQQFPLGREPGINPGYSLRIRATPTTAAATTVVCYLVFEE